MIDTQPMFRNYVQRDRCLRTMLEAAGIRHAWDDGGPTSSGLLLAEKDPSEPRTTLMVAALRLYRQAGGRRPFLHRSLEATKIFILPPEMMTIFGSFLVAIGGGHDDLDEWIEMMK